MSKVEEQKMASLPKDRIIPDEVPFSRDGVDYFGPFEMNVKRRRVKRYSVIFTCLVSRAVHNEVTAHWIQALTSMFCAVLSQEEDRFRGSARTMERTSLVPNIYLPDPFRNGTNLKFSQRCYRKKRGLEV